MHSGYQQQGFVLSVGLHATVLTIVAVLAWLQPFQKKPVQVFELIPRGTAEGDPNDTSGRIGFSLPDPPQPAPVVQPLRTPPPPQPQPQPLPPPQPRVQETPRLPPPKPAPQKVTAPAPVQKQAPAPKPPEPKLSYEEYIKQHGKPKPNTPRRTTAPQAPAAAVPRIDTKFSAGITESTSGRGSLGSRSGSTEAERNAVTLYLARLEEAIKAAWDRPNIVLSMSVDFDVEPSGRLVIVRVARSSGNAAFDESVLAAFRKVGSIGPTPGRQRIERTWNFHTREN